MRLKKSNQIFLNQKELSIHVCFHTVPEFTDLAFLIGPHLHKYYTEYVNERQL